MEFNLDDFYFKDIEKHVDVEKEGFFFIPKGRDAAIYFVENKSVVPIAAEMPAVDYLDILVWGETEHLRKRYYPKEKRVEEIPIDDRHRIKSLLLAWLSEKGWRHDINIEES